MVKRLIYLTLLLMLCISSDLMAHGDLHERIEKATEEIKKQPDSAYLYLVRGKLHFQHESYKESLKDLNKSKELGYSSLEQKLLFAKNYYKIGDYSHSLIIVDNILSDEPQHVQTIKLKAMIFFEQDLFGKSALAYQDVINYSSKTFPENYIDASIAWESLNNGESIEQAYKILHQGIDKLGKLVTLYERLEDLSLAQDNFDEAISARTQILRISNRKESAYFRLSELYMLSGDIEQAKLNLNLAKTHLEKLPLRTKNTAFVKDLILKIKEKEIALSKI